MENPIKTKRTVEGMNYGLRVYTKDGVMVRDENDCFYENYSDAFGDKGEWEYEGYEVELVEFID